MSDEVEFGKKRSGGRTATHHAPQKRDEAAFKQLVSVHKGRVYNLCLRMLSNTAEAEDIAQDAFVRAFLALTRFEGTASSAPGSTESR